MGDAANCVAVLRCLVRSLKLLEQELLGNAHGSLEAACASLDDGLTLDVQTSDLLGLCLIDPELLHRLVHRAKSRIVHMVTECPKLVVVVTAMETVAAECLGMLLAVRRQHHCTHPARAATGALSDAQTHHRLHDGSCTHWQRVDG